MSQFSHELISNFTLLWILFGLIIFVILLFIRAPYGKHYNTKWGPEINNKLGWIVMEMPALLICPITYLSIVDDIFRYESFFIVLWFLHYFNRTIVYPLKIKTKNKPLAIIAHTTKGKGVSFMEDNPAFHGAAPNDEQYRIAMEELGEVLA